MRDKNDERLKAIEARLSLIERMLSIDSDDSSQVTGATTMNQPVTTVRIPHTGRSTPDEMQRRAEVLFDELLKARNLISYSEAYRQIIGPYATWRNAVHAPAVIGVACETASRRVGPHTVRLDALIVGKETRRPAGGHFAAASYSEADWIRTFGTWPLLG